MRRILIILALLALWPGYVHAQIVTDGITRDPSGSGGGLTESDIDTPAKLNAFVTPDLADISGSQTFTNKTIDAAANTIKILKGTDCTTFNAAVDGQYCWDTDDDLLYVCETADVCDTAGEWDAVASATSFESLGALNAGNYSGADIGAKINTAIGTFTADKDGVIYVDPDDWAGASYSTPIVVDEPVTIIFPGVGNMATYTGTGAALSITVPYVKIQNFAVNLTGNGNADVDGVLVSGADAQIVDCRIDNFRIAAAVRHGINLDGADNGVFNCVFTNGRITSPGVDNVHIESSEGVSPILANANAFYKLVLNSTPASGHGIRIVDGYANAFYDTYIQGGNATAWGVYNSGDYNYFSNLTLDSNMTLGVKIDAGDLLIEGIRNNATGTAETISGTGAITKIDYSGNITAPTQFLAPDGDLTNTGYGYTSDPNTGFNKESGTGRVSFVSDGVKRVTMFSNIFRLGSTHEFCFAAGTDPNANACDTSLFRDAAGVLAQRNSTNAQTSHIYNTFTDGSNYERAFMGWNTNVFEIKPQAAGTGTERTVHLFGLADEATALAANGTNCSAGEAALGVDASGNAEGCHTPAGTYSLTVEESDSSPSVADVDTIQFNAPEFTVTDETNGQVQIDLNEVPWAKLTDVPAFRKTLVQLRPQDNEPPPSSPATFFTRNGHPGLTFNGDVCAIWSFVMPNTYGGNGVTVDIWTVSSETSNDIDWDGSWERIATTQDIDSDSFATAISADNNNNNATSGIPTKVSIAFTDGAQMDSCASGELCRFRLCRDATSDTGGAAEGNAVLIGGQIKETP